MKHNISRRDFLKLAGVSLGTLAFNPYRSFEFRLDSFSTPKRLPQFPTSDIIGRVTDSAPMRSSPIYDPNNDNNAIARLDPDTLVEWGREVVGSVTGNVNQRYVETPKGFIYTPVLQPTRNLPNTPINEMPGGQSGFWAEVTVPYVELAHEGAVASPWLQDHIEYNFPPRLYYGQVVWMDHVRTDNGFPEYRWNEDANGHGYGYGAYGEFYWADGAAFKILTDQDVAPISPDVDPSTKTIQANLDHQTLSCLEGNTEVYFCRISSGLTNIADPTTGEINNKLATPVGNLLTHWKIVSLNMTAGTFASGYSTPAVPWTTMISGDGISIHGAFWHNGFGEKRSHGCINVAPEDAKWIFRWTTPYVSLAQSEMRVTLPDHGTIVVSNETKF